MGRGKKREERGSNVSGKERNVNRKGGQEGRGEKGGNGRGKGRGKGT